MNSQLCLFGQYTYENVSRSFRIGRLERELQMEKLSATRCSCIAIFWVSLVSFAAITLCVASEWAIPKVSLYLSTQSGNFWITLVYCTQKPLYKQVALKINCIKILNDFFHTPHIVLVTRFAKEALWHVPNQNYILKLRIQWDFSLGLLGLVIGPSLVLYLLRTAQYRKTRAYIRASSGIRTHRVYWTEQQQVFPELNLFSVSWILFWCFTLLFWIAIFQYPSHYSNLLSNSECLGLFILKERTPSTHRIGC
jgi:hypothetical protein